MARNRQQRFWFLIAVIAILAAMVLLLVPHAHFGDAGAWLAILPVLLFGVVSPLIQKLPTGYLSRSRTPDEPVIPAAFQRPPPIQLG